MLADDVTGAGEESTSGISGSLLPRMTSPMTCPFVITWGHVFDNAGTSVGVRERPPNALEPSVNGGSTQLNPTNFGFARQIRLGNTTCRCEGIGSGEATARKLGDRVTEAVHEPPRRQPELQSARVSVGGQSHDGRAMLRPV